VAHSAQSDLQGEHDPTMTAAVRPLESTAGARGRAGRTGARQILLLSADPALRAVVLAAVSDPYELRHVESADLAVDALMLAPCGVLVLDLATVRGDVGALIRSLQQQFPDLVLIAAGSRDDEATVAGLLTEGTLYRFLHKPASPARAQLFLTAAIQRHADTAPATAFARLRAFIRTRGGRATAMGLLLALAVVSAYLALRPAGDLPGASDAQLAVPSASAPAAEPGSAELDAVLAAARTALTAGRLVEPPGDNALELYGSVLLQRADDPEALDGLRRVVNRLLTMAEEALAAGDIDRARNTLEYVRLARPDHPRLRFLDAQVARAAAVAEAAHRGATTPAETPEEIERHRLVGLAQERLRAGKLVAPESDSARHYLLNARRIDPASEEIYEVAAKLGARMIALAKAAVADNDLAGAQRWLDEATSVQNQTGVALAGLDALATQIASAATAARRESVASLVGDAQRLLAQAKVLEPAGEAALDRLNAARTIDPTAGAVVALEAQIIDALVQQARTALGAEQYDTAQQWAREATRLAPGNSSVQELDAAVDQAVARRAFLDDVVPAGNFIRRRQAAPTYPPDAVRRGIEGWVDVTFTIAPDGTTGDFAVTAAEPPGVFENAAIKAMQSWEFEPVVRDGEPVAQRAAMRLRFQLSDE
jgi:TonB family protein